MDYIIVSEISCQDKKAQEDAERLGIDSDIPEIWFKCAIDLRTVISIRQNRDDENELVTLYTERDNFTLKGNFDEILPLWKKARSS